MIQESGGTRRDMLAELEHWNSKDKIDGERKAMIFEELLDGD
jgi:hypothetical protein